MLLKFRSVSRAGNSVLNIQRVLIVISPCISIFIIQRDCLVGV